jgi:hypothetical protein
MIVCTTPSCDPSRGSLSVLLHILKFYFFAKNIVTDMSLESVHYPLLLTYIPEHILLEQMMFGHDVGVIGCINSRY